jgi:hypothetical protein
MQRENENPPRLKHLPEDERNLVMLCFNHHVNLLENARIYLTREMLPDRTDDFAGQLGLGWYLEKYWPGMA